MTLNKKIFGLDFLRATAILLVFLWHYRRYGSPDWLSGISKFGWTGVDLFFVLSGYLIGSQLFAKVANNEKLSVKRFYLKRFFRIMPAYLVVLLIYFTFPFFWERNGISPLWKFLTFTMNFGLDYQNSGAFSHAWSLCIEEQFYLVFPLIVLAFYKLKTKNKAFFFILFLFISGFLIRAYNWETFVGPIYGNKQNIGLIGNTYSKYIYYPTYNRLDGLLAGIFIALLYTFRPLLKEKTNSKANLFFITGIIILTSTYFICSEQFSFSTAVFSYPLVSIGYGFIVISALSPSCIINRFNIKVASALATLSYSIYLTHKQLNHITQNFLSAYDLNDNFVFLLCLLVSISGGLILYFVIERPFLKLRDRILNN